MIGNRRAAFLPALLLALAAHAAAQSARGAATEWAPWTLLDVFGGSCRAIRLRIGTPRLEQHVSVQLLPVGASLAAHGLPSRLAENNATLPGLNNCTALSYA